MSTDTHSKLLDSEQSKEKSIAPSRDRRLLTNQGQPHLRLVFNRDAPSPLDEPRKCAQSTSGLSTSHVTFPPDSRSTLIASDSPQGLSPYATLRKWPAVVPQREANASRSARVMVFKNVKRSMPDYHHMVNDCATPSVEFTKRCTPLENGDVRNELSQIQGVRRANLRELIDRYYGGNQARFARACSRPTSYINDVLKEPAASDEAKPKSFGEKIAWHFEDCAGLLRGELSIPNSSLRLDPSKARRVKQEIHAELDDLDQNAELENEILAAVRQIKERHRRLRRKTG